MSESLDDKGHLLQVIRRTELFKQTTTAEKPVISDTADIASYNWIYRDVPTIVVPGQPAGWTPPQDGQKIGASTVDPFHDANKSNYPDYVLEPAIASIAHLDPTFNGSAIDIVACGSTLTHLLSFALNEKRSFQIKVEKIGDTIFLVRQDCMVRPFPGLSYKRSMAGAFTTWAPAVADSESHQRIVSYTFGGLRMVVRYESDACISPNRTESELVDGTESHTKKRKLEELENAENYELKSEPPIMENAVTHKVETLSELVKSELVVESAGLKVPSDDILVVKSRSTTLRAGSSRNLVEQFLPRLWLRRIPNLLIAFHTKGYFATDESQRIDVRRDIEAWEKKNHVGLTMFNNLLRALIRISEQHQQFSIRRLDNKSLEVWGTPGKWEALSEATMQRWREGRALFPGNSDEGVTSAKKIKLEDSTDILDVLDNLVSYQQDSKQP